MSLNLVDRRKIRAQQLAAAIMQEIDYYIPGVSKKNLFHALLETLYRNGAYIMTDKDREELGLEPHDGMGWKLSERLEAKIRRQQAMLAMVNKTYFFPEENK